MLQKITSIFGQTIEYGADSDEEDPAADEVLIHLLFGTSLISKIISAGR